ncbi:hypothetical protein AQJ58_22250 [Streptomyces sp. DSM 15324]|nr:hypothetical protein AQJ58_22250 [Streptomyces sp. DSM 15324]
MLTVVEVAAVALDRLVAEPYGQRWAADVRRSDRRSVRAPSADSATATEPLVSCPCETNVRLSGRSAATAAGGASSTGPW